MQIQLGQSDVEKALRLHLEKTGISLAGKDVNISFTASRKGQGITATVIISEAALAAPVGAITRTAEAQPEAEATYKNLAEPEPQTAVAEEGVKSSLFG